MELESNNRPVKDGEKVYSLLCISTRTLVLFDSLTMFKHLVETKLKKKSSSSPCVCMCV